MRPSIFLLALVALLAFGCDSKPKTSGESHWLEACEPSRGCARGHGECTCGICTKKCDVDADCTLGGVCEMAACSAEAICIQPVTLSDAMVTDSAVTRDATLDASAPDAAMTMDATLDASVPDAAADVGLADATLDATEDAAPDASLLDMAPPEHEIGPSDVVINMLRYGTPEDTSVEFLEILNTGPGLSAEQVASLNLRFSGGDMMRMPFALEIGVDLPQGGRILLTDRDYAAPIPEGVSQLPLPFPLHDTQRLLLRSPTKLIDSVAYRGGEPGDEGRPLIAQAGWQFARCPDGADSDDNQTDFIAVGSAPGTPNRCPACDRPAPVCGVVEDCERICTRLGDCARTECVGRIRLPYCMDTCQANPVLVAITDAEPVCEGLIETVRTLATEIDAICGDVGAGDTQPLPEVNAFGAVAQLTALAVPATPEDALEAGCGVVGTGRGSGLRRLFDPMGIDLNGLLFNRGGPFISLVRLDGWQAGQTGNQAMGVHFDLMPGGPDNRAFRFQRSAFVNDNPDNPPRSRLQASLRDQLITTDVGPLEFQLPWTEQVPFAAPLVAASYAGSLSVRAESFDSVGVLEGYLRRAELEGIIDALYVRCREPACEALGMVAPTPAAAKALLQYDVRLEDGRPIACDANCDAIGICYAIELTATQVIGVELP